MKKIVSFLLFLATASQAAVFLTDSKDAFKTAKKSGKPILIDFFGIWCPPCNELEETVFSTPDFVKKSDSFVLLKMDADKPASWELKHRYKVAGYPTIIFANSKGEEITRFGGYRSKKEFLQWMDLALRAKGKTSQAACKSNDQDDLWRCAMVCMERKDKSCAKTAFQKLESRLKPESVRYWQAKTFFVEEAETVDLKRDGYERLIKENPKTPMALEWATDYFSSFETGAATKPKREILELPLQNFEQMKKDPHLDEMGIPLSDLYQLRATDLENLGKRDEAQAAWKEAADYLQKLASELPSGIAGRGFNIERIFALESAGETDAALKLSQEFEKKYPKEFTFHYSTASLLHKAKKPEMALPPAKQAFEASYGDNRIRAAILLIELYSTVPDKNSAKEIYEKVTKEIQPDVKLEVRTHRYLKKLKETYQGFVS